MNEIRPGEIVLCNMKLKAKKKEPFFLKDVVFSYEYDCKKKLFLDYKKTDDRRIIKKTDFKEDLKIISIEIISRHGFKNKSKEYTEVKQSNEKRNKTTGAYE